MKIPSFLLSAILVLAVPSTSLAQAEPSADNLLKTARFVATLQQQDLKGFIRKGERKFPVGLFLRGENIQLTYTQPGTGKEVRFHMHLQQDSYRLLEVGASGESVRFPDAKLGQSIEGSDLSYEDLSMRFLYWPNGTVDPELDKIKGQQCRVVHLANPNGKGRYAQVRVWVHKKSQALMKVVGYNADGLPLKRFQVLDIMKVGNAYTLRRMRVDTVDPIANKVVGLTYLELDKPKAVKPGGLR
jgi:hypothetical protein